MPGLVSHVCAALACAALVSAQATAPLPSFAVAVVRGDGVVVPVGAFDGTAWTASPRSAGTWHAWLLDDPAVKASPFAPRTPRAIVAEGEGRCGRAGTVPTGGEPGEAVAVATSEAGVRVDLLTPLPPDSDLGRWITERAAAPFHRAEEDSLSVAQDELPGGFPRFAVRRTLPIVWTRIVRHGLAQAATRAYYLEGRKEYEAFSGRVDVGRIRTTGHVFVQVASGRETADAEVDLSDVDGKQSVFRTPLAVIRAGASDYWLFAVRSYGASTYEVIDVSGPSRRPLVVLQAPAGC
jgi:hypothetical protein